MRVFIINLINKYIHYHIHIEYDKEVKVQVEEYAIQKEHPFDSLGREWLVAIEEAAGWGWFIALVAPRQDKEKSRALQEGVPKTFPLVQREADWIQEQSREDEPWCGRVHEVPQPCN